MHALTQGLRRVVELKPDSPSTSFAPRRRTWRQTLERVGRVAGAFSALDVQRGERIAILAQNSDRYFELMYAVAWIGAVMVPINTRLGSDEVGQILSNSRTAALFIDGAMAHHLTALDGRMSQVREVVWLDDISSPEGMLHYEDLAAYEPMPDVGAADGDLAGLFYDLDPAKVAVLTHADMIANATRATSSMGFDGRTIYLHAMPMFELAEDALTFAVTLAGGRHVFVPHFDPREALQIMAMDKVTHAQFLPTSISLLIRHPRFREFDLSALSAILYGEQPMPLEVLAEANSALPHVRLIDADGRTAG
jgi:long-chain acyl-CoA synthetase